MEVPPRPDWDKVEAKPPAKNGHKEKPEANGEQPTLFEE
jgi:hypothetical protein